MFAGPLAETVVEDRHLCLSWPAGILPANAQRRQAGSLTSNVELSAPKDRAKTRESAIIIKDGDEQENPLP